jgi:hypothetical protein
MGAIERLNRDLFRELGLSGDEVRTLIGVLTKMRRAWGDFEGEPDGICSRSLRDRHRGLRSRSEVAASARETDFILL